ncbi:MAG: hypothetical protein MZW92_65265 [Comamonadaceae bacterium]|nr:hypothetical protein [Comamonadaceae bacterium]
MARAFAAMIGRQIVVDPRVRGHDHRLQRAAAVASREAYRSYQSALRGLGFAVVESGGAAEGRARGRRQAAGAAPSSVGDAPAPRGDQVVTQIFRLRYEIAEQPGARCCGR